MIVDSAAGDAQTAIGILCTAVRYAPRDNLGERDGSNYHSNIEHYNLIVAEGKTRGRTYRLTS
jgi:hypothetical protein